MAEIKKIQIEDEYGNVYYPHSMADIVFMADGTTTEESIRSIKNQIDRYASITVTNGILNLPGGGDITVEGEVLSIPLKL